MTAIERAAAHAAAAGVVVTSAVVVPPTLAYAATLYVILHRRLPRAVYA